ncbi:MAG: endolytic transglycosylase MltG, partial [Dokdonella sp.]
MLQPVFPTRLRGRAVWRGLLGLLLLALLLAGAWLWRDYQGWTQAPLAGPPAAATLEVARGSGYAQIIAQLHQAGVPAASARERLYWRLLGRELGVANRLHAGEYALTPGLSPRALLQRMAAGQVVQHHFTIVDGWTFRQLRV